MFHFSPTLLHPVISRFFPDSVVKTVTVTVRGHGASHSPTPSKSRPLPQSRAELARAARNPRRAKLFKSFSFGDRAQHNANARSGFTIGGGSHCSSSI